MRNLGCARRRLFVEFADARECAKAKWLPHPHAGVELMYLGTDTGPAECCACAVIAENDHTVA